MAGSRQSPNSVTFNLVMLLIYDLVPGPPVCSDKQQQLGRLRDSEPVEAGPAFQKDLHAGPWPWEAPASPTLFVLALTRGTAMWSIPRSAGLSHVTVLPVQRKACSPRFLGKSHTDSTGGRFQHTCRMPSATFLMVKVGAGKPAIVKRLADVRTPTRRGSQSLPSRRGTVATVTVSTCTDRGPASPRKPRVTLQGRTAATAHTSSPRQGTWELQVQSAFKFKRVSQTGFHCVFHPLYLIFMPWLHCVQHNPECFQRLIHLILVTTW